MYVGDKTKYKESRAVIHLFQNSAVKFTCNKNARVVSVDAFMLSDRSPFHAEPRNRDSVNVRPPN